MIPSTTQRKRSQLFVTVNMYTHTPPLHSSVCVCFSPSGNWAQQARGWAAPQHYVISDTTRWLLVSTAAASP